MKLICCPIAQTSPRTVRLKVVDTNDNSKYTLLFANKLRNSIDNSKYTLLFANNLSNSVNDSVFNIVIFMSKTEPTIQASCSITDFGEVYRYFNDLFDEFKETITNDIPVVTFDVVHTCKILNSSYTRITFSIDVSQDVKVRFIDFVMIWAPLNDIEVLSASCNKSGRMEVKTKVNTKDYSPLMLIRKALDEFWSTYA